MRLKAHEVLEGVLGLLAESTHGAVLHLKDRVKLYECISELCQGRPDHLFDFQFRNRSGELVSADVDLCLRNLEDSNRLRCLNPDLVDFEQTSEMKREFVESIRPLLEKLDLLDFFQETTRKHLVA